MSFSRLSTVFCALCVSMTAAQASAGPNDLYLVGLVDGDNGQFQTRDDDFRQLAHELAVIFTPPHLQPAETTGQAGFDFALDYSITDISDQQPYWSDAVDGRLQNRTLLGVQQTLGVRGRKGFILPVPLTSEVELGAHWLTDSHLVNLGANLRLALSEGFRWIPDVAVITGINTMIGSEDMTLVTAVVGGSISESLGIAGSFNIAPYIGYQSIFVNAASSVIDADPTSAADVDQNVVFREVSILDAANNRLDRLSFGVRAHIALVQLGLGVDVNLLPSGIVIPQYNLRAGLYF